MSKSDISREELLRELESLQKKYESLNNLYQKEIAERKQREQALRESENNYKLLLDFAPDAFFQGNEKGRFILANKKASVLTGYSNEELLQMEMKTLFLELMLNYNPLRYDLLDKGEVITTERDIVRKDGISITVEMTSRKMPNGTYQAFIRDISERKKSEMALRQSEYLYRTVFENTGTANIIINEDKTIELANTEWANLAGYSKEDMEGKMSWTNFIALDDIARMKKYHEDRRINPDSAPRKYEFKFVRRSGEVHNMINCVAMIPGSKKSIAALTDITELKQAEIALEKSLLRNKALLFAIPDTMFVFDEKGNIIDYYASQNSPLYKDSEKLKGENVTKILPPDVSKITLQKIKQVLSNCQATYSTYSLEINDEVRHFESRYVCNGNNEVLSIVRDITTRVKAEKELIKAKEKAEESDRLKSAFLANMSHEIRTPMNGILGFANLLKQPQLTGEEQNEYVEIIEKSGNRMLNILNDIIDISKIESGQMNVTISELNIEEQVKYLYDFFKPEAEKKGVSLILKKSSPGYETIVKTDGEKVYAILTNLLKNALKFTDNGSIEIGYYKKDEMFEFFVKDTGIGIPKDRQNAIFERFIQADLSDKRALQGAGLGLSITKAYVEMLGGKIWVESDIDKGSTFYFTIPINSEYGQTEEFSKVESKSKLNANMKKLKVLVAEDDVTSDILLSLMLKNYYFDILHARNGAQAVEICQSNADIDLIMMDIRMPELDGYEATKKIREFNEKVVIIAQTAHALTGDREKALLSGCNDYISKPVSFELLTELIGKYFTNVF